MKKKYFLSATNIHNGNNGCVQSTSGWSAGNILLDLAGGLASLVQMVLVADNSADWAALTGDLTKLGLAAVSLGFDAVFLLQHFVLYRNMEPYTQLQD